jgi:hypothetical protein
MASGPSASRSWNPGEIRRLVSRMSLEQKAVQLAGLSVAELFASGREQGLGHSPGLGLPGDGDDRHPAAPSRPRRQRAAGRQPEEQLPAGRCPQFGSLLPVYLPANGALLAAVSLMAAGWDGAGTDLPGFQGRDLDGPPRGLYPLA